MKKFFALLLVCVLVFALTVSLTSCFGKDKEDDKTEEGTNDPGDQTPGEDTPGEGGDEVTGGSSDPITDNSGVQLPPIPVTPDKNTD